MYILYENKTISYLNESIFGIYLHHEHANKNEIYWKVKVHVFESSHSLISTCHTGDCDSGFIIFPCLDWTFFHKEW